MSVASRFEKRVPGAPLLVASGLSAASLTLLLASVGLPLPAVAIAFLLGVAGGALASFASTSREAGQRALIGLLAVVALSFVVGSRGVLGAWASVINEVIVAIDGLFEAYILPFRVPESLTLLEIGTACACFAAASSILVWLFVRVGKSALALGVGMLLLGSALLCGIATMPSMAIGFASLLFLCSVLSIESRRARVATARMRTSLRSLVAPLGACLVVALLVGVAVGAVTGGWSGAAALRSNALESLDFARYGADTLPEGQFTRAYGMNSIAEGDDVLRLEAVFESPEDIELSYFRGFVGSSYRGSSFEPPSISSYDGQWNGLFDWLGESDFDPLTQGAVYATLNSEIDGQQTPQAFVKLKAEQANRRYGYAPYQAQGESESRALLDIGLRPTGFLGLSESSVEVVLGAQVDEAFSPASWVTSNAEIEANAEERFLQAEHAYRSFVYDTYLGLPEGALEPEAEAVKRFFFSGDDWNPDTTDLYTIATRIRSMLESQCVFTAEPARYSAAQGKGYVSWFLEDEMRGNASAFAAASVLAFRQAGVPARYVEGYLLSQANVDALKQAGQQTARLTSREAHAWVEVYIDGVGWTPLEMTPGFYDKSYSAEQTIAISKEVAGDGSESELSGSLDRQWDDWIPEELRPFAWIGLLLLVVLIAFVAYGFLELQRFVRCRMRSQALVHAIGQAEAEGASRPASLSEVGTTDASALLCARLNAALSHVDEATLASIESSSEYQRIVELLQRERFGAIPLNAHEVALVQGIIEGFEENIWRNAPRYRRFSMRYRSLFEIPL